MTLPPINIINAKVVKESLGLSDSRHTLVAIGPVEDHISESRCLIMMGTYLLTFLPSRDVTRLDAGGIIWIAINNEAQGHDGVKAQLQEHFSVTESYTLGAITQQALGPSLEELGVKRGTWPAGLTNS